MTERRTSRGPGLAYTLTTARERVEMIARAEWAADLDWAEVVRIAQFFDAFEVEPGAAIFREGDADAWLALVVDGQVRVTKRTAQAEEAVIATLGAGKTFGEMSLVDGLPRSASVFADAPTRILVLNQSAFARLTEECPRLVLRIVLPMTRLLSERLRATSGTLVGMGT